MRVAMLVVRGGCSLYFAEPKAEKHEVPPDAAIVADAAPDAQTCPAPGTHAEIAYPLDGATNVATPVPIANHVYIPNTLDGKGLYLSDANGVQVDLGHYDPMCSIPPPAIETGPVQDVTWTECYDLPPDAQFTWHLWVTCYDASGSHELATSTFRTAP
jgi:hypothetical protein